MARPTLLTPKVQRTICAALRDGHSFEVACEFAGIAPSTGYEWCARGEGHDRRRPATSPYREFAEAVARAEGALWRDEVRAQFAEPSERSKNRHPSLEHDQSTSRAEREFALAQSNEETTSPEGFAETEHEGARRSTFGDVDALARPANPTTSHQSARFAESPGTSRHVQAQTPFAEAPENRCQTGDAPANPSEKPAESEFAEPAKSDTQKRVSGVSGAGRARAREQDPMRTTDPEWDEATRAVLEEWGVEDSFDADDYLDARATAMGRVDRRAPMPWTSQRSRRKGAITRDITETIF